MIFFHYKQQAASTGTNTGTNSRPSIRRVLKFEFSLNLSIEFHFTPTNISKIGLNYWFSSLEHVATSIDGNNNLQIDDQNDYVFECAVCLHADPQKPFVVLSKCGHIVHKRCLQGQNVCPQCRSPFKKEEIFDVYLNLKVPMNQPNSHDSINPYFISSNFDRYYFFDNQSKSKPISNSVCPEAPVPANKSTLEKVSQADILKEIQSQKTKPDLFVFGETQEIKSATSTSRVQYPTNNLIRAAFSPFSSEFSESNRFFSTPSNRYISQPKALFNRSDQLFEFLKREPCSQSPQPFILSINLRFWT